MLDLRRSAAVVVAGGLLAATVVLAERARSLGLEAETLRSEVASLRAASERRAASSPAAAPSLAVAVVPSTDAAVGIEHRVLPTDPRAGPSTPTPASENLPDPGRFEVAIGASRDIDVALPILVMT